MWLTVDKRSVSACETYKFHDHARSQCPEPMMPHYKHYSTSVPFKLTNRPFHQQWSAYINHAIRRTFLVSRYIREIWFSKNILVSDCSWCENATSTWTCIILLILRWIEGEFWDKERPSNNQNIFMFRSQQNKFVFLIFFDIESNWIS